MEEMFALQEKYKWFLPLLNERQTRLFLALETIPLGRGGITLVSRASGVSRTTLYEGLRELDSLDLSDLSSFDTTLIRQPGGGRKKSSEKAPSLIPDLEALIDADSLGDPESLLKWTCKSTRHLAEALSKKGHSVTHQTVANLLHDLDYSLQGNQKTKEGNQHEDRDAQFKYIQKQAKKFVKAGHPAISVDTKKKELVGEYKNNGREWRPEKNPIQVKVHDFPEKGKGKAIPYGVYDLAENEGWVNVGITHDTAEFAVSSIRQWWTNMGKKLYEKNDPLFITADGGGSNGSRVKLWKWELQGLANLLQKEITVSHYPPGTSKWNKIEHRMFCHITMNWRGKPLVSYETIVSLIGGTKTAEGLRIKAKLDRREYPTQIKPSKEQMGRINIQPHTFHPEWNYVIKPNVQFIF